MCSLQNRTNDSGKKKLCMYCSKTDHVKKSVCRACKTKIKERSYTSWERDILSMYYDCIEFEAYAPPPVVDYGIRLPMPAKVFDHKVPDAELFPRPRKRTDLVKRDLEGYTLRDVGKMMRTKNPQLILAGVAIAGFPIGVLDTSLESVMDAVRCRAGQLPFGDIAGVKRFVEPDPTVFQNATRIFDLRRDKWNAEGLVDQMSDYDWLKTQRRFDACAEALEINEWTKLGGDLTSVRMQCSAFGKSEKKGLFTVNSMSAPSGESVRLFTTPLTEAKPRLIQGYPTEWLSYVGPFVKTVQHRVEAMFNLESAAFYAGAANPNDLNWWLGSVVCMKDTHYFICIDYSMMDSTHTGVSFDFVEDLYFKLVRPTNREDISLADALKKMRWPQGLLCNRVKYKAGAPMNGSGRPDTSLLNIVNSMFALILSITAILYNVDPNVVSLEQVDAAFEVIKIIASGDDSVSVVPREYLGRYIGLDEWSEKMAEHISRFGFIAKVEPNPDFAHMVFLGNRAYPVAGEWLWGPTIGRRIVKHHHLHHCTQDPVAVLHGICDMEAICYPHVPVLSDMAEHCLTLLEKHSFNHYEDSDQQYKVQFVGPIDQSKKSRLKPLEDRRKAPKWDNSTLEHLADIHDLAVDDILDCIEYIRRIPSLPAIVTHPVLTRFGVDDN